MRPTGEATMGAPAAAAGGEGDSAMPVGIWEGELIGVPQLKQKRLSAGTSLEHHGHFISGTSSSYLGLSRHFWKIDVIRCLSPVFSVADQDQVPIHGTARQDQPVVGRPVEIPDAVRREVRQLSGRPACERLDPYV